MDRDQHRDDGGVLVHGAISFNRSHRCRRAWTGDRVTPFQSDTAGQFTVFF
jgi:hypothetical protein